MSGALQTIGRQSHMSAREEHKVKRKSGCGCVPGLLGLGILLAFVIGGHYLAIHIDKRRFH